MDIILFNKEEGITSFSSLYPIKRLYPKNTKIGHAGTLDKFASGLMIVLVGNATKLNPVFSGMDKSYIASIQFGKETDTLDPEGRVIKEGFIPKIEDVKRALKEIEGKSMQEPPVYSAIHVGGKRAYQEARKEHEVIMPKREIEVFKAEMLSYQDGVLKALFHVSKGTYIRSLARDIAYSIGTVAHLENLQRISIGPYTLSDIGRYGMLDILKLTGLFSDVLLDLRFKKQIDNGYITEGAIISDSEEKKGFKLLYFEDSLYAIAEKREGKIKIIARV